MNLPPTRPGRVPAFYGIGEDTFEDLCRDLAQRERYVDTVERYGTRGQGQDGIDLLIHCNDGLLFVGQCKSHKRCDAALIRKACDDFLEHADHWRREGARRFVLFLAADIRPTQLHDERFRQRQRLGGEGFAFSVWSGAVLLSRLRKHRDITRHYFPWLEAYICGPETQLELQSSVQQETIQLLATQLGDAAESDHAEIRKLWQDGHASEALTKLRTLKQQTVSWGVLALATKSKLLRLEGRLLLTAGDIATAKSLSAEADSLHSPENMRLRAMIAQAEARLDDAIDLLRNDSDSDSQSLMAAIQLQSGQVDAAFKTLSTLPEHSDACRLRAIIYFIRRDALSAKAEAERALALAPTWYWMRRTAAMMRYLAGLSPIALPKQLPDWPEPINPSLVRQDDESVEARRRAVIEFEELSHEQFEHSADELACLQAWRLACLADNKDTRQAAHHVAKAILDANPANYRVLTWAVGRDLNVDISASITAIAARLDEHAADVEEVIALVAAHAKVQQFADALRVLARTRALFEDDASITLWEFWNLQVQTIEAVATADSPADRQARVEETLSRLRDPEHGPSGDQEKWQQYALLAQLGRWDQIAPVADEVIASIRTPDAIRMASYALYNTRDFAGCLKVLDAAPAYFPKQEVPADLRRLRALAERAVGALPDAIRTARDLFDEVTTKEAFLELARLYFLSGDFKSLALHARRHDEVPDLFGSDFLTLAFYLKAEDQTLAITLWRLALEAGIDDDHVGTAFEIGNNLGLGVDLKPVAQRLAELGREGKGGVQAVRFDELREWAIQRRQHIEQIWQLLRHGQIPNHIALGALGIELSRVFHHVPTVTASNSDGISAGPVCQRFGGRVGGILPLDADRPPRLNADITAILSAAHFGWLDEIEKHFAPIRLPQDTILALNAMREGLRPGQPRRVDAQKQVVNAVSRGRIRSLSLDPLVGRQEGDGDIADDVLQLLRRAIIEDALVLEFVPVRSVDPMQQVLSLPAAYSAILRDAHSVVAALVTCGVLARSEGDKAVDALGHREAVPTETAIPRGKKILCRGSVVELLAQAGVLEQAASTFTLLIPAEDLEQDRREIESISASEVDAVWLGQLIERLRQGLETRRYELLPDVNDHQQRALLPERHVPNAGERVLLDLIRFRADAHDVIWSDDRWLTSHQHRDGVPIAGTVDLLAWLKGARQLTSAAFWQALTDLRAADIRYIAFDDEELLTAISEAPIRDNHVEETKPLRVFRQYYARCLIEADMLRPPAGGVGTPNSGTEWNFLLACGGAVVTAMVMVWRGRPASEAAVRADWLLRNMHTDDRGVHGTQTLQTAENDAYRVAVSIVSLITGALRLDARTADERKARRDYLTWLFRRIIRPRFDADRQTEQAVYEQLKATMLQGVDGHDEPLQAVAARLMQRLWSDLPKELRDPMSTDQEFLTRLGVTLKSIVEIGPLRLERRRLWETLSAVLQDGVSRDATTFDGHPITIQLESSKPIAFLISCDKPQFAGHIGGGEFGFLSESIADRQVAADQLSDWFDMPASHRRETIASIVGGQDAATRLELATEARHSSGAHFYQRLFDSIKEGETFDLASAIPSDPTILLDHLRCAETAAVHVDWAKAAESLIEDVGVVDAVNRLAGLPITLPDCIVTKLSALPRDRRRRALMVVRRILLASPVGVVQLADLWKRLPIAERHVRRVVERIGRLLVDDTVRPIFTAWLTVLQKIDEEFRFHEPIRSLPVATQFALSWSHADRVFRILMSRSLPPEWIEQAFSGSQHLLAAEITFPDSSYTDDVAASRHVRAEDFVLAALAYLGNESRFASVLQSVFAHGFEEKTGSDLARIAAAMMNDRSQAGNALSSWLASERMWVTLLPAELEKDFSVDAIRSTVEAACRNIIEKSEERRNWFTVGAVCGHLPPALETRSAVENVLANIDLVDYVTRDPMLAITAVNVIGAQAHHLSYGGRQGITEPLLRLAEALANQSLDEDTKDDLTTAIVATLVGLTWLQPDGSAKSTALATLLERLSGKSASVFARSGPFVLRLCDALPVMDARLLWRVRDLVRLNTQL